MSSPAPTDQKVRMKAPDSNPNPNPNPSCVKSPGKPADPPRRLRNHDVLSIKEIRQAANKLREQIIDPPSRPDLIMSYPASTGAADIRLPEKYELLDQFFNRLDTSIRLLHLRGFTANLSNIRAQIEKLTDRSFTYGHLAQLKFIMPEAIEVKKVLLRDEHTGCMKPDLHVTLSVESDSGNLQLRKDFRARLLDFVKSHPEGDEVPEEELPVPISQFQQTNLFTASTSSSSGTPAMVSIQEHPAAAASHLSQAFKRSFSRPGSTHYAENLKQE